jgi:hypothetical protein
LRSVLFAYEPEDSLFVFVRLSFSLFDERAMFRPLTVEPVNSQFAGQTITSSVGVDHTNIGQICTLIGYILQDERMRTESP